VFIKDEGILVIFNNQTSINYKYIDLFRRIVL